MSKNNNMLHVDETRIGARRLQHSVMDLPFAEFQSKYIS